MDTHKPNIHTQQNACTELQSHMYTYVHMHAVSTCAHTQRHTDICTQTHIQVCMHNIHAHIERDKKRDSEIAIKGWNSRAVADINK